jgi:hypothetical protein
MERSGQIHLPAGFPEGQVTQKPSNKRLGEPHILLFDTKMYFHNKTSISYSILVKVGGNFGFFFPCL